jgi:hypothetical protein
VGNNAFDITQAIPGKESDILEADGNNCRYLVNLWKSYEYCKYELR